MLTEEDVIAVINNLGIEDKLDPNKTSATVALKSLGIDSLDMFNLLIELESKTGKKVPDDDVQKLTTIKELVKYFA